MSISRPAVILIVIVAAGFLLLCAYGIYRSSSAHWNDRGVNDRPDLIPIEGGKFAHPQFAYMREVKRRNVERLSAEARGLMAWDASTTGGGGGSSVAGAPVTPVTPEWSRRGSERTRTGSRGLVGGSPSPRAWRRPYAEEAVGEEAGAYNEYGYGYGYGRGGYAPPPVPGSPSAYSGYAPPPPPPMQMPSPPPPVAMPAPAPRMAGGLKEGEVFEKAVVAEEGEIGGAGVPGEEEEEKRRSRNPFVRG